MVQGCTPHLQPRQAGLCAALAKLHAEAFALQTHKTGKALKSFTFCETALEDSNLCSLNASEFGSRFPLGLLTQHLAQDLPCRALGDGVYKEYATAQLFVVRNLSLHILGYLFTCKIFGSWHYICSTIRDANVSLVTSCRVCTMFSSTAIRTGLIPQDSR